MGLAGYIDDEVESMDMLEEKCPQHDQFEKRLDQRWQTACDEHRSAISLIREDLSGIWPRLRAIELKIAWGSGIISGLFFVFQVLPWLVKLIRYWEGK